MSDLILENGKLEDLNSEKLDRLDQNIKNEYLELVEHNKFLSSDGCYIIDLLEPSNKTLMYISFILAGKVEQDEKKKLFISQENLYSNFIFMNGSIKPYISAADQILERVNPESDKFVYKNQSALIARPKASEELISRLQIFLEPILYKSLTGHSIEVVVSEDFEIPYAFNMYANVIHWSPEQYKAYEEYLKNPNV